MTTLAPRPEEPEEGAGASRGQVIAMAALFMVAMMGVLGLAVDLGFSFAQRRAMQAAADAGALAGARAVARWTESNGLSASADVTTAVNGNHIGSTDPTIVECYYVNYANTNVGACGSAVPATATGVRVRVQEEHPTFFIRVVPGAPSSVTVGATATAQVQRLRFAGMDGPFIVCGYNTKLASGGQQSILLNDSTVDPAAIGQTFVLHSPHVQDCGVHPASFKGRAVQNSNVGKDINQWWLGDTGTAAGPTRVRVIGIEGCNQNVATPYNCVLLLPIAVNNPAPQPSGGNYQFYVTKILAFRVSSCGANCHQGVLLDDYIAFGAAASTWCRDCGGVVVVRLTQ